MGLVAALSINLKIDNLFAQMRIYVQLTREDECK